jgi:Protein of unknown function N-terminal domain (DUF2450).
MRPIHIDLPLSTISTNFQNLKDNIDNVEELQKNMKTLTAQHQAVCKQVVDLINLKQDQFNSQFEE